MAMTQLAFPARPLEEGIVTQYQIHFSHLDAGLTTIAQTKYLSDADGNALSFPADSLVEVLVQIGEVFNSGTSDVITVGDGTAVDTFLAAGDIDETTVGVYPALTVGRFFRPTAAFSVRAVWVPTFPAAGPTTGECDVIVRITPASSSY